MILKDKNNSNYIKKISAYEEYKDKNIKNDLISFYYQFNHLKNIYRQGWVKNLLGKELGKSNGYYFGYSSYFRDFENTLYNYELEEMYQIIFNPKNVLDLWDKVEDGTLKINDKYAKKLKKLGAVTYTQNYNGALKEEFNKIELFKIDVDSELVDNEKDDDVELLRAINRWHVDQHNNE